MDGYFLNFFTSRRGRSNIEFPGGAQVGLLGYESALPFLSGLYGKHAPRPGRKMGHFTVIGVDSPTVLERALKARAAIGIRDEG